MHLYESLYLFLVLLIPLTCCYVDHDSKSCGWECKNKIQFLGSYSIQNKQDCSVNNCIFRYHVYSENGDKFTTTVVDNENYERYRGDKKYKYIADLSSQSKSSSVRGYSDRVDRLGLNLIITCENMFWRCTVSYLLQVTEADRLEDAIVEYVSHDTCSSFLHTRVFWDVGRCIEKEGLSIKKVCIDNQVHQYKCSRDCTNCIEMFGPVDEFSCTMNPYASMYVCPQKQSIFPPEYDDSDTEDNNDGDISYKVVFYAFFDDNCRQLAFEYVSKGQGRCESMRYNDKVVFFKVIVIHNGIMLEICSEDCEVCNRVNTVRPTECGTDPTDTFGSALYTITVTSSGESIRVASMTILISFLLTLMIKQGYY